MRIKMLQAVGDYAKGAIVPVEDSVGRRYVAAGYAEAVPGEHTVPIDCLAETIKKAIAEGFAAMDERQAARERGFADFVNEVRSMFRSDRAVTAIGEPAPDALKDDGTPVWIWSGATGERFAPFDGADTRFEVSAPGVWLLKSDSSRGIVLASISGSYSATASEACELAIMGEQGFRVRKSEQLRS